MYDDNSRGLESPERPVEATVSDQRILADGGTKWADLTGFQRDIIEAVARLEETDTERSGQAIKDVLEETHGEVLHGRLYQNLDSLIDDRLVERGSIDGRTNRYTLTTDARRLLHDHLEQLADACGERVVLTDGGQR
ncbi:helix-turn-helix transcriptional regulator [Natronoglomus mannanivorans]|uniref:PadR family transcriptional regulator n=1 Tax=Natronoglomus mannanivorans TaxID=2979990 RepID=A0AAP2Z5G2_9EURY|nr:PadR family transcriptional regulator [Halobacteria archaeon AArc-xg1-1]